MKAEAHRELQVLEELSANSTVTQRRLSQKLEVALGLTNLMIRRLIKKGYVKAVNLQKNRIRYLLTPQGIREKSRLTYEYLEYSLYLYRRVREVLKEQLRHVAHTGGRRIVVFGTGEIAEITYLTLKELDLELVAVIDDQAAGQRFLGFPIVPAEMLPTLAFDRGIISARMSGFPALWERLSAWGIADHKLIVIEHTKGLIHAATPLVLEREPDQPTALAMNATPANLSCEEKA